MISSILKFVFAGAIILWLFYSGKLDFSLFVKTFKSGNGPYFAILFYIFAVVLSSYRWKIILEAKTIDPLPFKKILPINWIGLFFSTFLPGVVTGDVVKLLYIKDLHKNFSKTYLLTSIFIDRIIGLCGLLFLTGFISIIKYEALTSLSPEIKTLVHFNFFLFAGSMGFIVGLFLPLEVKNFFYSLLIRVPKIGERLKSTLEQAWLIGQFKLATLKCLFISILAQLLGITAIWLLTKPFYPSPVSLDLILGVVPIGLITVAIPISPSGAGVGHLIFEKIFNLIGVPNGASLFNIHFLVLILVNLFGVIPYILFGKKHSIDEAEKFEEETS